MPSRQQWFAADQETLTSVRLIHAGLGQLQSLNAANDFYHLPLLTLANGFERFMKVIICLRHLETTGEFPSRDIFRRGRKGHDLEVLADRIRQEYAPDKCVAKGPIAKQDAVFLASPDLRRFVKVLSDFGQAARYHYLDVLLGERNLAGAPERVWEALETQILLDHPAWKDELLSTPASEEVDRRVCQEVIIRLERFARALARLFTIGGQASRFVGCVQPFLFLNDEELGHRRYNPTGGP